MSADVSLLFEIIVAVYILILVLWVEAMFHSYEPYRYFMTIIIDNKLCDTTLYRALSGVTTSYSNLASWEDDSRIERRWLAILPVIHCWRRNFFKSIEGTHNERFGKNQFRHNERCPTTSEIGECFAPHLAFGFSKASAPSCQWPVMA